MGEHKHHRRKSTCIGFDAYNQVETGDISKSLNASATDSDHIPCVYAIDQGAGKSGCNVTEETAPTLACTHGGEPVVFDGSRRHDYKEFDDVSETVQAQYETGGNNTPIVVENVNHDGVAGTLDSSYYKGCGERQGIEREVVCIGNGQVNQAQISDKVGSLNCMHDQQAIITYGLDRASFNQGVNAKYDFQIEEEKIGTQVAKGPGAICNSIVRRLTPKECERLQAFPDDWTNIGEWTDSKGKVHKPSDSNRYKALGNSIALCWWEWMAERMLDVFDKEINDDPTMASLFDGIGGFPLVFKRCGCIPVWASEIEEFPIAVTKIRFPEYN